MFFFNVLLTFLNANIIIHKSYLLSNEDALLYILQIQNMYSIKMQYVYLVNTVFFYPFWSYSAVQFMHNLCRNIIKNNFIE